VRTRHRDLLALQAGDSFDRAVGPLARAAGVKSIAPGEIADVEVDTCLLTDMNFMPASWRHILTMKDPARVVVVLDHLVPANEPLSAAAHTTARAFVHRFGIKRFHDVAVIRASAMSSSPITRMPCQAQ
jgi:3-isopropylmalate/(R)-2-methylmalate dehydratase large subunit